MSGSLGVNIEDISWWSLYAIANVIIIPLTRFPQNIFWRKIIISSRWSSSVASYMCGQSVHWWIIIRRFIQVLAAVHCYQLQAILFDAFTEDRPIASGLFGMGDLLGQHSPTLVVISSTTHHGIDLMINILVGHRWHFYPSHLSGKKEGEAPEKRDQIDIRASFAHGGIGCLQYVLERGEAEDWFSSTLSKYFRTGLWGW